MAKKNNITEAEWPIMQVLWDKGAATSAEIIDSVTNSRDVTKRTLKALINRLLAKKAVTYVKDAKDSRIYHYSAAISREEAVRIKNRGFLNMIYDNNPMNLLTHFVKDAPLSAKDIEMLQNLLRDKSLSE